MSKDTSPKGKKQKKEKEPDGFWRSNERQIQQQCAEVYPTMYKTLRVTIWVTSILFVIALVGPTLLERMVDGYEQWGNTFQWVTIILVLISFAFYVFVNYHWQEKMEKFRKKNKKK